MDKNNAESSDESAANDSSLDAPRSARTAALHRFRRARIMSIRNRTHFALYARRARPLARGQLYLPPRAGGPNRNNNEEAPNSDDEIFYQQHQNLIPVPYRPWRRWTAQDGLGREQSPRANNAPSDEVPALRLNGLPISDEAPQRERARLRSPPPSHRDDASRWRRPRLLHPRYFGPNPFEEFDMDAEGIQPGFLRYFNTASGMFVDPIMISEAPVSANHRIQAWDFTNHVIPDISNREINGVVGECKIHNDASVDVSADGSKLVTLLPSGRLALSSMLGVYSLDWSTLGQLLYRTGFEQNAVSVSFSPTARYLLVGVASRPMVVRERANMAHIFQLKSAKGPSKNAYKNSSLGMLRHIRDLEQRREMNIMSLNCIRWAPGPGSGLVYGTNTGHLRVLR